MDHIKRFKERFDVVRAAGLDFTKRRAKEDRRTNKLRQGKLTLDEACVLARRLHDMLEARAEKLKGRKADVAGAVTSRELYRVTLPEGADATVRRPRLHLQSYERVVEALARITGEDAAELQYELRKGTAMDVLAGEALEWDQNKLIADTLAAIVRKLDQKWGWSELYSRTATQRLRLGTRCTWPHWNMFEPISGATDDDEDYLERYLDPDQVFYWNRSYFNSGDRSQLSAYFDCGHIQDAGFFYVPHALLGYGDLWDVAPRRSDPKTHEATFLTQLKNMRAFVPQAVPPKDEWDIEKNSPTGQLDGRNHAHLQYVYWLIAYPDPLQPNKIIPALYQAGEEGGACVIPLDKHTVGAITDGLWLDNTTHSTIGERLILLLTPDEKGVSPFEQALDRTGGWLAKNPVLQLAEQIEERTRAMYDAAMRGSRP
ncbi:hypothetical protein GCM10007242_46400 [Pigmentiphaga litoralis]|uniref:hypothetical protein n=1 Tax=Pigmentiphaga litoralis TaxID=516702 RepID=UPI0016751EA2|nr:hypothetical protein [Pigmentiphaga litoralis]GGX34289.1 hypothetical protein GCM10007242_46400 [Pigmentiphaga litoralis]